MKELAGIAVAQVGRFLSVSRAGKPLIVRRRASEHLGGITSAALMRIWAAASHVVRSTGQF